MRSSSVFTVWVVGVIPIRSARVKALFTEGHEPDDLEEPDSSVTVHVVTCT
jgi:hypothetical protein